MSDKLAPGTLSKQLHADGIKVVNRARPEQGSSQLMGVSNGRDGKVSIKVARGRISGNNHFMTKRKRIDVDENILPLPRTREFCMENVKLHPGRAQTENGDAFRLIPDKVAIVATGAGKVGNCELFHEIFKLAGHVVNGLFTCSCERCCFSSALSSTLK